MLLALAAAAQIYFQPWLFPARTAARPSTVPASTLETAKRLALKRKVHLNVVVNEALEEGLRQKHPRR